MMVLLTGVGVGTKPPYSLQNHNWDETTINGKRVYPPFFLLRRGTAIKKPKPED